MENILILTIHGHTWGEGTREKGGVTNGIFGNDCSLN